MAMRHVFRTAFLVGTICFAAGFIGPLIVTPGANQGPLLGIFITGPLGFLVGLLYGVVREWRSRAAGATPTNPDRSDG